MTTPPCSGYEASDEAYLNPPYPLPFKPPTTILDAYLEQVDAAASTLADLSRPRTIIIPESDTSSEVLSSSWFAAQTISFEVDNPSTDLLTLLFGGDPRPALCDQIIPAKGTE